MVAYSALSTGIKEEVRRRTLEGVVPRMQEQGSGDDFPINRKSFRPTEKSCKSTRRLIMGSMPNTMRLNFEQFEFRIVMRMMQRQREMVRHFRELIEGEFETCCPVCYSEFSAVQQPIVICSDQHVVCEQCRVQLRMGKTPPLCPVCRRSIIAENRPCRLLMRLNQLTKYQPSDLASKKLTSLEKMPKEEEQGRNAHEQDQDESGRVISQLQREIRSFLDTSPIASITETFKKRLMRSVRSKFPLIGLGNEEEVKYYLEETNPIEALQTLGHSYEGVSDYDLLSFFLVYHDDKAPYIAWYEEQLRDRPDDPGLLWGLANLYYNTLNYPAAQQLYFQCYSILPRQRLLERAAMCAHRLRKYQEVKELLERVSRKSYECLVVCEVPLNNPELLEEVRSYQEEHLHDGKGWILLSQQYPGFPSCPNSQRVLAEGCSLVSSPNYHYYCVTTLNEPREQSLEKALNNIKTACTWKKCPVFEVGRYYSCKAIAQYETQKMQDPMEEQEKERFLSLAKTIDSHVHFNIGLSFYHLGEYQQALSVWRQVEKRGVELKKVAKHISLVQDKLAKAQSDRC